MPNPLAPRRIPKTQRCQRCPRRYPREAFACVSTPAGMRRLCMDCANLTLPGVFKRVVAEAQREEKST